MVYQIYPYHTLNSKEFINLTVVQELDGLSDDELISRVASDFEYKSPLAKATFKRLLKKGINRKGYLTLEDKTSEIGCGK